MRLYLARHGESEANVLRVFSNRLTAHGLTALGRQQAAELADTLRAVRFAAIYCSPILRARQTAEIVAERLGMPFQVEAALREYDVGVLEGRDDEASWQRYWEVYTAWMERRDWDRGIEGGESYDDIRARFMPFVAGLEQTYRDTDANILLIGHGGTFKCVLPLLLANVSHAFCRDNHIANTGYILAELRGNRWAGLSWCGETLDTLPA